MDELFSVLCILLLYLFKRDIIFIHSQLHIHFALLSKFRILTMSF